MRDPTPTDLVVELLRTLDDALIDFVPWTDGGGPRMMPSTYSQASYPELEARLIEMRDSPLYSQWRHVSMRYRWGAIRRDVVRTRKTAKGRVPIMPPRSELRISGEVIDGGLQVVQYYTWSAEVNLALVSDGVAHLVTVMHDGDTGKLKLPLPFLHRMLGLEGGTHDEPRARDLQDHPLAQAQGGR